MPDDNGQLLAVSHGATFKLREPSQLFTELAVCFVGRLRDAGLPVSVDQAEAWLSALGWLGLENRTRVYCAARATLLNRHDDAALFEQLFAAFWGGPTSESPAGPIARRTVAPRDRAATPLASLLAARAHPHDEPVDVPDRSRTASPSEVLQRKDFSLMSAEELDAARQLLTQPPLDWLQRRTRRRERRKGPELNVRRLLALAARHAGALPELPQSRRRERARPLTVLADVSGSMELYTRLLLCFFHAWFQRSWVHGQGSSCTRTEAFVFATRLTRVTGALRLRHPDRALDAVAAGVADIASGTRIGASLREFNRRWAGRTLGRGAVVLILSDGCDCGDAQLLQRELRTLRARAWRIVWLNPRLGQNRYEPKVEGMRVALQFVDDFVTCHSLQSLRELQERLWNLPKRRSGSVPLGGRLARRFDP
jgi:uncharacterized protein